MAVGRKTGGRLKGTPNKATKEVKDALAEAFEKLGGVSALVRWGKEEPGEFYKLWARMLPHEIRHGVPQEDSLSVLLRQISGATLKPAILNKGRTVGTGSRCSE
ncbi:hypothetical protein [Pseudomonas schmalbachii]|uniref:Uncharacterized protein n=1 Tax=Pseudomonas schmalbachii TaxID=2816993 RepID=A0ABS3TKD8_9PSED|nr:hypothetical protein [Pseudomonas schmalbachii]MBO3274098.1 hypothetical protein [Pseudomonas schmalbachii]